LHRRKDWIPAFAGKRFSLISTDLRRSPQRPVSAALEIYLAVTAQYAPEGEFLTRASNPFIISQFGFMLFVGATARIAWKGIGRGRDPQPV
jgi:hypothetical protein